MERPPAPTKPNPAPPASLRSRLRRRRSILVRRLKPKPGDQWAPHEHVHHHHIFGHPVPHAHGHGHDGVHGDHAHHRAHAHAHPATHHSVRRKPSARAPAPAIPAVPALVVPDSRPPTPATSAPTPEPPRARTPLGLVRRRPGKERAVSEPLCSLQIPEPDPLPASSLRSATPAPSVGHRRTLSNKMLSLINGIVARRKDDKPAPAPPPLATPAPSVLGPRVAPARPHRPADTESFITRSPEPSLETYPALRGVFEAALEADPFCRVHRQPADLVSHFSDSSDSSESPPRHRTRRHTSAGSVKRARRSPVSFQYSVGSGKSSSFRVPWRRVAAPGVGSTGSDDSRRNSASSSSALSSSALASIPDGGGGDLSPVPVPRFAAPPSPPTPSRRVSSAARHDSHASARIRTPPLDRIKVWSQSAPDLAHLAPGRSQSQKLRLRKPRTKKSTVRRRRSSLDL